MFGVYFEGQKLESAPSISKQDIKFALWHPTNTHIHKSADPYLSILTSQYINTNFKLFMGYGYMLHVFDNPKLDVSHTTTCFKGQSLPSSKCKASNKPALPRCHATHGKSGQLI